MNPSDATPLPIARRMSREHQWRLVGIGAAALVALWLVVLLIRHLAAPVDPAPAPAPPGTFRATPAQMADLGIAPVRAGAAAGLVQATGTIGVDEERSTPIVLPFSGQVTEVLVEAGQQVSRGQPLLRVASADYNTARNALAAAQAQVETSNAQLRIARDTAARQEQIYKTAGGALKDYRQAQSDLVTAQAQAATAASALATAQGQLALVGGSAKGNGALATYTAPTSGVVVQRNVAPGQYVGAGASDKPLLTIADIGTVWLVAQLSESDAALVKVGDPVTVTTPAYPGRTFSATIDNVAAALDPTTHRLPVRASVANPGGLLKPQMFASFAIQRVGPASPRAGLLVPSQAVIHEGDTARVWLSLGGGLLRAQPVTVGDSAGGYDTITAGLKPGDRVVTSGALFVNQAGLGA